MFINIDDRAAVLIGAGLFLLAWALVAPESVQSTLDAAQNALPEVTIN